MPALRLIRMRHGRHIELTRTVEDVQRDRPVRVHTSDQRGLSLRRETAICVTEICVMNDPTD